MLKPDGVVVHVDNRHQDVLARDDTLPAPPLERIAEASPDGAFAVRLPDNELKIWRVAAP